MNTVRYLFTSGSCRVKLGACGNTSFLIRSLSTKFTSPAFHNNRVFGCHQPNVSFQLKFQGLHDAASKPAVDTAPIQGKKRTIRSKKLGVSEEEEMKANGFLNVSAFSTAEEYNLEELRNALKSQNLYSTKNFIATDNLGVDTDVLYVTAKYQVDNEPRDIFFFREGSVVLWNCNEIESNNILSFLKHFERDSYLKMLVKNESEVMPYKYLTTESNSTAKFKNGQFFLTKESDEETNFLEKYTFSNAIATSIKLGVWESNLERYIDSMEYITEDLKKGRPLKISRAEVLRKTGELFALRHMINLSSDLLDTPDFYWDREELENLYQNVCNYFSISRRTKVMNEKLNHCVELAELVSSNLNDAHHIRLEWMIIILIMVEVGFEILHYIDRYYSTDSDVAETNVNSSSH